MRRLKDVNENDSLGEIEILNLKEVKEFCCRMRCNV